jgi:hypothetical protein
VRRADPVTPDVLARRWLKCTIDRYDRWIARLAA